MHCWEYGRIKEGKCCENGEISVDTVEGTKSLTKRTTRQRTQWD